MGPGEVLKLLAVFAVGFAPVAEVRGAIPLAYKLFMVDSGDPTMFSAACLVGVLGNLAVAPAVLLALERLERLLLGSRLVPGFAKRAYSGVLSRVRRRARRYERLEAVGLVLFVAVPLPATGAWTGSLVAYVLGLDRRKSLVCVELGVLVASAVVLSAVLSLTFLLRLFGIEL